MGANPQPASRPDGHNSLSAGIRSRHRFEVPCTSSIQVSGATRGLSQAGSNSHFALPSRVIRAALGPIARMPVT